MTTDVLEATEHEQCGHPCDDYMIGLTCRCAPERTETDEDDWEEAEAYLEAEEIHEPYGPNWYYDDYQPECCPFCGKEYEDFSDMGCEHCDRRHPLFGIL